MPSHWVAKCGFAYDTTLPRDVIMINPCFRHNLTSFDAQNFANDLANALVTWTSFTGPLTVKMYDLQGTKPVFPAGEATKNAGAANPSYGMPRELAICLSFYGTRNVRRDRGRLYLPAKWVTTTPGLRPTTTMQNNAMGFRTVLESAGGPDVDWIVWSRAGNKATKVQNVWVDDEWDIVRRRGLRGITRVTASSSA